MRSDTGTYALHIVVGFALLVMVFLVFMEPETYEFLFPFIFFTSAAFALFGSWLSMRRSPKKERRITILGGAILCGIFTCLGILAAAADWLRLL